MWLMSCRDCVQLTAVVDEDEDEDEDEEKENEFEAEVDAFSKSWICLNAYAKAAL